MSVKRAVLLFAVFASLAVPRLAGAAGYSVGFYAPEVEANVAARFRYASRLATHLTAALGLPVAAKAYKTAADLLRDQRAGRIHFGVVSAFHAAADRQLQVLAAGRMSAQARRWTILARSRTTFAQLKGKRIQVPRIGGVAAGLLQNALLDGLDPKKHFKVGYSPDVSSATAAVRLGKAEAVFGPESIKLHPLFSGVSVPPPAFVILSKKLPRSIVDKLRAAVLRFAEPLGVLKGWDRAQPAAYGALLATSQRRVRTLALVHTTPVTLDVAKILPKSVASASLPPLEDLYWLP